MYRLKEWIDIKNISWDVLSLNPNAIELLKAIPAKIDWNLLSRNPNAIELFEANSTKIDWNMLSNNPNAIKLLEANPTKINWFELSSNPNAIKLLEANPTKINWNELSLNFNAIELLNANLNKINWRMLSTNPNGINLLKINFDSIDWELLSSNPNAIELLKANFDKIDWMVLSSNPNAIELLKANPNKINWKLLSSNPNAIELLKENLDKIDWYELSRNPNIFNLYYNNELMNIQQSKHNKNDNNKKKIKIINSLSGDKIILKHTIKMINTLESLYYKISNELNKPNISTIIINQYVYKRKEYLNSNSSLEDTCLNRCISSKVPDVSCYLSELFDKDYNEDYIEVLLIYGSYIPYLKNILGIYQIKTVNAYKFKYSDNKKFYDIINSNNSCFVFQLSILDNNYLSLEDYNVIILYITKNINLKLEYQNFVLNEIENYFTFK